MADDPKPSRGRHKPSAKGELRREQVYLYEDEALALETAAEEERCSRSEIMRRALRFYLKHSKTSG
ncbi:MAG TPA: CopG family transcriptional regulator [Thermoanaerobaculia bacterium]|nr:CopG family transcriptional regulator [Thermoanaerobaculia bacterium]